jgi:D-alanine-D-alanine ligase
MKPSLILYDRIAEQGGDPDHRDVLFQAEAVAGALREMGWKPVSAGLSLNLAELVETLKATGPAFVFNLVESVEGHGRLIHIAPALLDTLGVDYTGSTADALYVTSNKRMAKKWLESWGIPTPASCSEEDLRGGDRPLAGRYILKSTWEHASIGLGPDSVVQPETTGRLLAELERRRTALGGEGFAESYIDGREFNLSLLASLQGPEVLPPAEIRFTDYPPEKPKMVDYRAKWEKASFEFQHTVRSFDFPDGDRPLLRSLEGLAKRCWRLFALRGYARVDFRVDQEGRPWVLEVNANPCISPDAGFAAAAARKGLSYRSVVQRILQDSGIPEQHAGEWKDGHGTS